MMINPLFYKKKEDIQKLYLKTRGKEKINLLKRLVDIEKKETGIPIFTQLYKKIQSKNLKTIHTVY